MTKLFVLRPEVAGGQGPATVVTNLPQLQAGEATVPEVSHLEYQFSGWLGDELLASTPCYIVTRDLAEAFRRTEMTGVRFESVEVSYSDVWEYWIAAHPNVILPPFERLIPEGAARFTTGREVVTRPVPSHMVEYQVSGRLVSFPVAESDVPPFVRRGGQVVSWSGHDACWGTRADFVRPNLAEFARTITSRLDLMVKMVSPHGLVVSERCFALLQRFRITYCDVEELQSP